MRVSVKWVCINTRESVTQMCPVKAPLSALKVVALADLPGVSPDQAARFVVKKTPTGAALDEKQNLEGLGITSNGSSLYLAMA